MWRGLLVVIGGLGVEGFVSGDWGVGVEGFVSGDWGVRCGGVC